MLKANAIFSTVLEKAEEPEFKLRTSAGSWKKQEISRKTSIFALLTVPNPSTVWITINCGKFWKRWNTRTPDLPLEKPICRSGSNSWNWTWNNRLFQIGKGVCQVCILSPCLFNLYVEYIMRTLGVDEAQAGMKIAGRNINNLRYADDATLMAESEELKSLLVKVKGESEKVGLKLNFQKTKIILSGPILSWQIDGETEETVRDFNLLGSRITADGDCSHEMKRHLLLGRKIMTNLDSLLKSRDITLPT